MSLLSRQGMLPKMFAAFSITNQRIAFQLNELTELIRLEPDPSLALVNVCNALRNPTPIVLFKWLILINKLVIEFTIDPHKIIEILASLEEPSSSDEFQQILNNKLIKPYKLYLMKRCQFLPKKSCETDRMYQLLNLLHTAASFSQMIYTLGRYYNEKYAFAVDFNIVLGSDISTVYKQMVRYTPRPTPQEILNDFERLHEKLYVVYYNCYFYKSLKPFVPQWIVTDSKESTQIKSSQNMARSFVKSNKSLVDTACSSKGSPLKGSSKLQSSIEASIEDLSKSEVFSTSSSKKNTMEESMMLLKSMERVFEEIEDF